MGVDPGPKLMTAFAEIGEFERDLIGDRTSAGRETASRRGTYLVCLQKAYP